jgi:hypothetical protein
MRRFVTLLVLLLSSVPFGVSISGCAKNAAPVFCNGGDSGITTGQLTTIVLQPQIYGISLNYGEIGQLNTPSATDCHAAAVSVNSYTFGTTNMAIADVQPTTGRICAGSWNRNSGGGIPDYTYCTPPANPGPGAVAYIAASAGGVTSNPVPIFVHPVVTSIVLGGPATAGAATITAWSIGSNSTTSQINVTFTAQNSFSAGQAVSLSNFQTSTFFNGVTDAVVQASGLSPTRFAVFIPGFTQTSGSATETGLATGPGCSTNPSTDCCPLGINPVTAPPYLTNSCVSQGTTTQLVARVYAGAGANQTNISCYAGHLQYTTQGATSLNNISPIVSIDQNGVATANQPGSVLIQANVADAASSAGFFSTCPPASIALTAQGASQPGTPADPVVVNENNPEALVATAFDTNGKLLTGLSLEYVSTSPTTIPGSAPVTPFLAGAASITAICEPPTCNPSSSSQIGLFGNGKAVTSNPVSIVAPGTNSTVLFMASTQSQYVVTRDFTQTSQAAPFLLPFVPNSMLISNDGSTIYMGSSTGLMVLSAVTSLSMTRADITSPGTVLALSPDGTALVIANPEKQIVTIESSSGGIISSYGAACPAEPTAASPACRAEFTPDSQTVYITAGNQLLVYSGYTGWTNISPATGGGTPVSDVAITVPSVGAYFAGPETTARGYCASSTASTVGGVTNETNAFFPSADCSSAVTDRVAATNDGLHILGATVSPVPTLQDLLVQVPIASQRTPVSTPSGTGFSIACPATQTTNSCGVTNQGLAFSNNTYTTPLSSSSIQISASAITGIVPTSDSSLAFITYTLPTGSSGTSPAYLPAYAPAASGLGKLNYVALLPAPNPPAAPGTPAPTAPIAGVISADNTTFYVGTTGDNLVHIINRATLTDSPSSALAPKLPPAPGITVPSGTTTVPVNLLVQKPRRTT